MTKSTRVDSWAGHGLWSNGPSAAREAAVQYHRTHIRELVQAHIDYTAGVYEAANKLRTEQSKARGS